MTPEDVEKYAQVMLRNKIRKLDVVFPGEPSAGLPGTLNLEMSPEAFRAPETTPAIDGPEEKAPTEREIMMWSSGVEEEEKPDGSS